MFSGLLPIADLRLGARGQSAAFKIEIDHRAQFNAAANATFACAILSSDARSSLSCHCMRPSTAANAAALRALARRRYQAAMGAHWLARRADQIAHYENGALVRKDATPRRPPELRQCKTLVRAIEALDRRLRVLRDIELNRLHNAVTAANLRGEISDAQGVELQRLIQERRRSSGFPPRRHPHLGG